jgi:hypothetical protein
MNAKLTGELEKYKKNCDELHSRVGVVQSISDRQQLTITKLEDSVLAKQREIDETKNKLKELVRSNSILRFLMM